jgi:hypothetical protein
VSEQQVERIRQLVERLAKPHEEKIWTGATIVSLPRDPLLSDLRSAVQSNLGRTSAGRSDPAARSPIDLQAFEMYEDIAGRIDSFYKAMTGNKPRDTPEESLTGWFVVFRAFHMSGRYEDRQVAKIEAQLKQFVSRIESYLDPPRVKEIAGSCPMEPCRAEHVKAADGSVSTALYASYRKDEQPVVKCRACGSEWVGERSLLEIGFHIGATVDADALREMGVSV